MQKTNAKRVLARSLAALVAAGAMLLLAYSPSQAGGAITNFNIRNCTPGRIFVCSFDKTDSLMKIPYKAAGIQPGKRKEFGCASTGRCKVIIGVSKKKAKRTLSSGVKAALATGAVGAAAIAGASAGGAAAVTSGTAVTTLTYYSVLGGVTVPTATVVAGASTVSALTVTAGVAAVAAIAAGGAVAALEIKDGWSDGEVCNQVRKAAEKAGLKPKDFLQNGKKYAVVQQYATDKKGNPYVNSDGTAVFAYVAKKGKSCPASLKTQLVPNVRP